MKTANKALIHSLIIFTVAFSIVSGMAGCAKIQQTLNTVLAKEPSVIAIVNTAIDLVTLIDPTAADPTLKAKVDGLANTITTDIRSLNAIIVTYQNSLGDIAPGDLQKVNALYAAIDANLGQLQTTFGFKSAKAQALSAAILDSVDIFLSELGSFLPPAAAATVSAGVSAQSTAKTKASLTGSHPKIMSAKDFVNKFNKSANSSGFPQIHVAG